MAFKTLLINLNKAWGSGKVKCPHTGNYWRTEGKNDFSLLLPKSSMHVGPGVGIPIYGSLPASNTETPGITLCLIHSCMSPLQAEYTSSTEWGCARAFKVLKVKRSTMLRLGILVLMASGITATHSVCGWLSQST